MTSQNNERLLGNTQKSLYDPVVDPVVDPVKIQEDIAGYLKVVLEFFNKGIDNAKKLNSDSKSTKILIDGKEQLEKLQLNKNSITITEFVKNVREIYKLLYTEKERLISQRNSFIRSSTKQYQTFINIYNKVLQDGLYGTRKQYPYIRIEYGKQQQADANSQSGGNRKSKRSKRSQSKTKRAYRKTRYMRRK